jgi:hypothetical protein
MMNEFNNNISKCLALLAEMKNQFAQELNTIREGNKLCARLINNFCRQFKEEE